MVPKSLFEGETLLAARARFKGLEAWLLSGEGKGQKLHSVEQHMQQELRELGRLLLQEHVRSRGLGDVGAAVKPSTGEALGERRVRSRHYRSVFGEIEVERTVYSATGVSQICPKDEDLSLPERKFSYVLQENLCTEAAKGPYDEARDTVEEYLGQKIPKRVIEQMVVAAARDMDRFYEHKPLPKAEETGGVLVAAVDRKGVPINKKSAKEHRKRLKKGEKPGVKKMATVAAVYTVAPHKRSVEDVVREVREKEPVERPRPEAKRVWASLEKPPEDIFGEVKAEMERRDPGHAKKWVCLTDGERKLQRLAVEKLCGTLILILDLYHVLEYLWKAAYAFHAEGSKEAEEWVTERLRMLLKGQVSEVVRGMRQSATKRGIRKNKRKAVDTAAGYFLRRKAYMRYDEYLRMGLPIGSGAAEGACRNLIKDRLERTGMRWTIKGAEGVIKLRAVKQTGDTKEFWEFRRKHEHDRLYAKRQWIPLKKAG